MTLFVDISSGSRDNGKECLSNANLFFLCVKRFGKRQLSFIGPGSEKKWYCISEDSPQRRMGPYGGKDVSGISREWLARRMGSPSHGQNRRRGIREGPEPACVRSPTLRGGPWGKDELTSCRGTV